MQILRVTLILLSFVLAACTPSEKKEEAAAPPEVYTETETEKMLNRVAEKFQPTKEEAAFLEAGPAVNILGQTNGYFTNQAGVTGYFAGYDMPFNFIWEGEVKTLSALDGQTYQVMDGEGKILVKYRHDDLLLQRYEGGMSEGLWHGYGNVWFRNQDGLANSYNYVGEFQYDLMEGRGVFTNYDFFMQDANPTEYKGEFQDNAFHGQGAEVDLVTGQLLFKGLWLTDEPFSGGPSRWEEIDRAYEKENYGRLITVGPVEIESWNNNPTVGEGALTVITPEEAKNVEITLNGQPQKYGLILHPYEKSEDGSDTYASGLISDIPPGDYPQALTVTFEREGRREGVSLTAKRPFILELN